MRPRMLKILGLLAVAGLAAAWWLNRDPGAPPAAPGAGTPFLPDLRARINDVTRLEIDDGKAPVAVVKRGSGWVDPARGDYPVKGDEVKRLLLSLHGLEKREAKTANPALHGQLKLALEGDDEQRGTLLRIWAGGEEAGAEPGAAPAAEPDWEIVTGTAKWSPVRGIYVRHKDENQCWLAVGELQLPYAPTAWLDKEVMNVNQMDVARVTLVRGAETYTVTRSDSDTPWALAELPEGRALKSVAPFSTLANTLGYLNFEDVARADDPRFAREADLVAEFACFNGASVRLRGWREGEQLWARFEAAPPDAPAAADPAAAASDPAADPAAAAGDPAAYGADPDAPDGPQEGPRGPSAETIAQWSGKWVGWIYQMPEWKATGLGQGLDDWLEPLPEAPGDAVPGDEAAPGNAPPADEPPADAPGDAPPADQPPPADPPPGGGR